MTELYDAVHAKDIEAVRRFLREGHSPTQYHEIVNILFVSLKLMKKFSFL